MKTTDHPTFQDLFTYARRQARIEFINYSPYVSAWRTDKSRRDRQRKRVMDRYGFLADRDLPVGKSGNGRLIVTDKSIDYCVGCYAPTEIWDAVFDFLQINYSRTA